MPPLVIAITGISSDCGKTTLLCDLLRELSRDEPWEAIKLTRGHYRSCGKDPHACCVSHLLGDEPAIRSGRQQTFAVGKDTGRYWDAGASNVHWVIATNNQVEQGIRRALDRVQSRGVLVEGTSFVKFIKPDFTLLVVRHDIDKIKPSARNAILGGLVDAIYLPGDEPEETLNLKYESSPLRKYLTDIPVYRRQDRQMLVDRFRLIIFTDSSNFVILPQP